MHTPLGVQILSFSCSFRGQNWKIIALLGVGTPPGENPRSATDCGRSINRLKVEQCKNVGQWVIYCCINSIFYFWLQDAWAVDGDGKLSHRKMKIKIKMMEGKVLVFLLRNCPLPKERMINSSSGRKMSSAWKANLLKMSYSKFTNNGKCMERWPWSTCTLFVMTKQVSK